MLYQIQAQQVHNIDSNKLVFFIFLNIVAIAKDLALKRVVYRLHSSDTSNPQHSEIFFDFFYSLKII